jgi:cell volume regulation protein A
MSSAGEMDAPMNDSAHYALIILFASAVGLVAVMANRLTERVKVPVPLLVLLSAAAAVQVLPALVPPPEQTVERIITVALVLVLFDGGMHIGWTRFRAALIPIAATGVVGTFLTALGATLVLHYGCGIDWYLAVLVATAVAPWCSPSWASVRSLAAAAPSWKGNPAPTIRSESP